MNDEKSPLTSPVPVAIRSSPQFSETLGTVEYQTDFMPFVGNRFLKEFGRKLVDLRIAMLGHDRKLLVRDAVDFRPDFFSA